MVSKLQQKRHLCESVFALAYSIYVHYGYYRDIFAVFMPEAMSTNSRSVTVRAPCVKCVGVFFLFVRAVVFLFFFCICVWECVYVLGQTAVLIATQQCGRDSQAMRHRSSYYPSHPISSLAPNHRHLRSAALALHQPYPLFPTSLKSHPWLVKRRGGEGGRGDHIPLPGLAALKRRHNHNHKPGFRYEARSSLLLVHLPLLLHYLSPCPPFTPPADIPQNQP